MAKTPNPRLESAAYKVAGGAGAGLAPAILAAGGGAADIGMGLAGAGIGAAVGLTAHVVGHRRAVNAAKRNSAANEGFDGARK